MLFMNFFITLKNIVDFYCFIYILYYIYINKLKFHNLNKMKRFLTYILERTDIDRFYLWFYSGFQGKKKRKKVLVHSTGDGIHNIKSVHPRGGNQRLLVGKIEFYAQHPVHN